VYLDASSQSAAHTAERRRNIRHKACSIIYAQLGSGNGGIVLNLGPDGLAFQAAMKLTTETSSTVNLRLRGSGLNAELVGELVWLGATQKQAGISFKGVSANIQKDITDWIAREEQDSALAASGERSRPMPMPAAPVFPPTGEKSVSHSFASALAMSRAMPADSPSGADGQESEPSLQAAPDPTTGIPAPILDPVPEPAPELVSPVQHSDVPVKPSVEAPLDSATEALEYAPFLGPVVEPAPELVSPIQLSNLPGDESGDHTPDRDAETPAPPEHGQVDEPLFNHLIFERPPISRPQEIPSRDSSADDLSQAASPQVHEQLPQAIPESVDKNGAGKTEEIAPIPQNRVSPPARRLVKPTKADLWLPPEVVGAWRRANPQRKVLLAAAAAACLMILPVILALALRHNDDPLNRSGASIMVGQSTANAAASSLSFDFPQAGPLQAPRAPHATVRPQPDPLPPPSFLDRLAKDLWGADPPKPGGFEEPIVWPEITDAQVVVLVWTSKASGYYFCADSPYVQTMQPGTFMSQGDALQTGYQPILGKFCN
jgi:hypothetical protein